jgi:DNA-directed RNA polymerase specialized sigma24 family protein
MATRWKEWPALDTSYTDEYGYIDLKVYDAAREIWPKARVFGEFALQDSDAAFKFMLKAAAAVSARLASTELPEIDRLKPYLFRVYKNLIGGEKAERIRHHQPLDVLDDSLTVDIISDVERKILLRELFSSMSEKERDICTLVMFGYRHDQIADILDLTPSAVRKQFSRLVRRLADMLSDKSTPSDKNL